MTEVQDTPHQAVRRPVNGPFQDALANEFQARLARAAEEISADIAARRGCTSEDVFVAVAVAGSAARLL